MLVRFFAGALMVAALAVSVASLAVAATGGFPDVPATHPYYAAVTELASRDIIGGYAGGYFGPNDPVTRQQFAKMIVLTGGYPVSEGDVCPFADVQNGGAATLYPDNYVAVAAARRITVGVDTAHFSPLRRITRLQVVSMVVRMSDELRPGLLEAVPVGWSGTPAWVSDPTHGANAARAEYTGLLEGLDLGALNPTGDMSRGEVAQVLYNLLGLLTPGATISSSTTSSTATSSTATSSTATSSSTTTTLSPPTTNPDFESLAGAIGSAPAVCSQRSGEVDVFAGSVTGTVLHGSWTTTAWSGWEDLGGAMKAGSNPAAVSWGPGRLDVFIRGADDALWHRWWDGSVWSQWENLGGTLAGDPTAVYRNVEGGQRSIDVYALGPGALLWQTTFAGGSWTAWRLSAVGAPATLSSEAAPAAATWGTTREDLVVCDADGFLWHNYLPPGGAWRQWKSLGGAATSSPSVCTWGSWAEGRLEVFVRGLDNGLWHRSMVSGMWSAWANLQLGPVLSAPAAIYSAPGRIDLFVRGMDSTLWHTWSSGSVWLP